MQLVLPRHLRPRREKIFGPAPSHRLDGNAKARVWASANAYNSANRVGRQHQGPLTWATLRVLRALLWRFHSADGGGRCFPSYERIAAAAKCHRDSVCVAIRALEDAGILTWVNRIACIRRQQRDLVGHWVTVFEVVRSSNGYRFLDPLAAMRGGKSAKSENPARPQNREFEAMNVTVESLKTVVRLVGFFGVHRLQGEDPLVDAVVTDRDPAAAFGAEHVLDTLAGGLAGAENFARPDPPRQFTGADFLDFDPGQRFGRVEEAAALDDLFERHAELHLAAGLSARPIDPPFRPAMPGHEPAARNRRQHRPQHSDAGARLKCRIFALWAAPFALRTIGVPTQRQIDGGELKTPGRWFRPGRRDFSKPSMVGHPAAPGAGQRVISFGFERGAAHYAFHVTSISKRYSLVKTGGRVSLLASERRGA